MHIGFLIRYFKPGMGGAENNCYYLAKELAKDKSNKVYIFCSDKEEGWEEIDGIKVIRCKETLNLTYYLGFYRSIVDKLLNTELDILHVHGFGFIQNDLAVKRLKKAKPNLKIVCTPHGPFMALQKYNLFKLCLKYLYMPFVRRNLKQYSNIIQVNPFQKEWMMRNYDIEANKIVFLPNGIDESALGKISSKDIAKTSKKYALEDKFVISYLGRVQKYKGMDQVVKILPELKKIKPNITFLIAGKDAGDSERLRAMAKELGVENNVVLTGEVSEKEKLALLDLSEIFVFPSEWEAFGIVVLEAMARGNAILSTRTEGGRYLVKEGENGELFDYQNGKELFNKIKKIILNDALRAKMQKNNIKKVKDFLWSKIARELNKIYTKKNE